MRMLLIYPPFQRLKGLRHVYFPIGLGYINAVLEKEGFYSRIYNAEVPREKWSEEVTIPIMLRQHHEYIEALNNPNNPVWKEVSSVINNFNPDVVGLSVMTCKYGSALKVSHLVKEFNPECLVVWGGPHPTIQPREILKEQVVDFVVQAEGEETIAELCQHIAAGEKDFTNIAGIHWKKEGKIIANRPRSLIENLDSLPFPARESLLFSEYYTPADLSNIMTGRGCPFDCDFCGAKTIWTRKVRSRSVNNIIDEIYYLKEQYHTGEVFFWDDSFTINRKKILELCEIMVKKKVDVSWTCTTRVDLLDDKMLHMMKKAGCKKISIGIETGSPRILELVNKKSTLDQAREAARLLRKNHIDWEAFLMIGFPDETEEDIQQTIAFARELKPTNLCMSIFTPYPGSRLFEVARKYGLISNMMDWSRFSHQSPENHFVMHMDRKKFQEYVREFSDFVFRYNHSFQSRFNKLINNFSFEIRHPLQLLRKVYLLFMRRFRERMDVAPEDPQIYEKSQVLKNPD